MSVRSSTITGINYHDGIRDGFLERNAAFAVLKGENTPYHNETTGDSLGDVDMVFMLNESTSLELLFPLTDAFVQHLKRIESHNKLFLEVTAVTGEDLLVKKNNDISKLEKKVSFYNHLHDRKIVGDDDLVVIIYNGTDPVQVKSVFDDLNPHFRGAVIHFNRKSVIAWKGEEKDLKSQKMLLEKDTKLLEKDAKLLEKGAELLTAQALILRANIDKAALEEAVEKAAIEKAALEARISELERKMRES